MSRYDEKQSKTINPQIQVTYVNLSSRKWAKIQRGTWSERCLNQLQRGSLGPGPRGTRQTRNKYRMTDALEQGNASWQRTNLLTKKKSTIELCPTKCLSKKKGNEDSRMYRRWRNLSPAHLCWGHWDPPCRVTNPHPLGNLPGSWDVGAVPAPRPVLSGLLSPVACCLGAH